MAIAFTYTESTNTVVLTGGTSGTPATFADFVTADRAGTADLLPLGPPASPTLPLDYQIRPVENTALLITFNVASKTTETDYIFITGTDWRDAAQTESLDVSAGDGAYVTTKYFRTITNIDCSDNSAGGGTVWADGTIEVTQPQWGVIWDYGLGQYQVDCNLNFGDGSTSTYFASERESVRWIEGVFFYIKSSAELRCGRLLGDWGVEGANWTFYFTSEYDMIASGSTSAVLKIYASHWMLVGGANTKGYIWRNGTVMVRNSMFRLGYDPTNTYGEVMKIYGADADFNRVYLYDLNFFDIAGAGTCSYNNVHIHNADQSVSSGAHVDAVFTGPYFSSSRTGDFINWGHAIGVIIDPVTSVTTPDLKNANSELHEAYTVNIHVTDKDGIDLVDANVQIQDINSKIVSYADSGADTTEVLDDSETGVDVDDGTKFVAGNYILIDREWMLIDSIATNTLTVSRAQNGTNANQHVTASDIYTAQSATTDVSGNIVEQIIVYKQWIGTSETMTTYLPHKFTLSKAGYETLILENVTVDAPIVWHLELQHTKGAKSRQIGMGV